MLLKLNFVTSMRRLFFLSMALVSIVSVISIGTLLLLRDFRQMHQETLAIRKAYVEKQKLLVKNEVEKAIALIVYEHSLAEQRLKEDIRQRTYEAVAIARHLYDRYHRHTPSDRLQGMILDALRPIRFNHGRGYFFATSLDGLELLFADRPEMEGKNILSMRDTDGRWVIKDMIRIARSSGEGYYQYRWTKPSETGRSYPKVAFIKYVAPLDGFIGTGDYLDSMERHIQQEVLKQIGKIRYGDSGYIFVVDFNGVTLMNGVQPELIGRDMWELSDPYGVKVIQEERRAAEKPGGDFIHYHWQKPGSGEIRPKISFVKGYPEWKWIIGAGVYVDEIDARIAALDEKNRENALSDMATMALTLAAILLVVLWMSLFLSRLLSGEFDTLVSLLQRSEASGVPIDTGSLYLEETKALGASANKMLANRKTAEKALRVSESKWRQVLVDTPQIGISLDPSASIVFANRRFLELTGWSENELIGRNWFDRFVPEALRDEIRGVFETVMKGRDTSGFSTYENEILTRSGERLSVAWSNVLTRDENGDIVDVTCLGIDLTERKRSEEALRRSENLHRSIIRTAMDGFWLTDLDGRILEVNDTYCQMCGFSPDELSALGITDLEGKESPAETAQHIRHLVSEGQARFETIHHRKDGTLFDVEVSANYLPLEGGRIVSFLRDITDKKRIEKERTRLISAIAQADEMFVITDIDGAIQYVNPAFERTTGYGRLEAIGQTPRILKSGHQDDTFYNRLWQTILSGETWKGRMTNRRKDGTLYVEECIISPVSDDAGIIVNFVAVKRDISAQLHLEAQLRQAQKMESIGNLAGGIAHDFNNILFPIVGMSEMLMEDLPAGSMEYQNAREILRAGRRGSDLVKQILAFSRQAEHKMLPLRPQQVLKEVIKLMRSSIPSNISIVYDLDPDCGMINGNPTQIHQVAMNLITNAYHAVEQTDGRITVRLEETIVGGGSRTIKDLLPGRYAMLTVSDTGGGIRDDVLENIFEPYFTTKAQDKGTGLGLAVVYGIVKEHGGDISVDTRIGRGTTFTVYLPLIATEGAAPEASRGDSEADRRGTERILLVDDEAPITLLESQMLKRLGYHVTACTSSTEALKKFMANPDAFDLVISDLTMPAMTGDRLAQRMIDIRPDVPVIICTGFSERFDKEMAAAIGIKGFLMKPVVRTDMAKVIRMVLGDARDRS